MTLMKSVCVAVLSIVSSASAFAAPLFLGSISLSDRPEFDVLRLPACNSSWNQRITNLKVEVRDIGVELNALQVQYQNGDVDMLRIREHIPAGGESRWIDLQGGDRCVRFIRVIGDADTYGRTPYQKARVLFYGR